MGSITDMRGRLEDRLGYGSSSGVLQSQLEEAINAGMARAWADGVRGLQRDVFTGETFGELTTVVKNGASSVGDTTITVKTGDPVASKVAPQDILEVTSGAQNGDKYIIRDITSTTVLDLGAPLTGVIEANATTKIIRRSIELPSAGSIVSVKLKDGAQLTYEPRNAAFDPYKTGDPLYLEQRYSSQRDKSYLILYPAPTSATVVTVIQNRAMGNDDDFKGPEEALDAVLERAVLAFKTWQGQTSGTEAGLAIGAVRDTDNALHDASSAQKFFIRQ